MNRRPDLIICDDVVDYDITDPEYRAKVLRWYQTLKGEMKMKAYELPTHLDSVQALANDISFWAEVKGFWSVPEFMKWLPDTLTQEQHEKAWAQYHRLKKAEKIALMHSEASENLEGLRKQTPSDLPAPTGYFTNEEEELADLIIRALDYAGHYHLRIGLAIGAKMAKNEGRPFMHGKNF